VQAIIYWDKGKMKIGIVTNRVNIQVIPNAYFTNNLSNFEVFDAIVESS